MPHIYRYGYGCFAFSESSIDPNALINYTFTDIKTNDSSKNYISNKVVSLSPDYDGLAYSGRSVTLSGDGKIEVPVNATLGSDIYSGTINGGTNKTDLGGGNWNIEWVSNTTAFYLETTAITSGDKYLVTFDAIVNSGEYIITQSYNADGFVQILPHKIITGLNVIEVPGRDDPVNKILYFKCAEDDTPSANIDFINTSAKEITEVQGSVTTFDYSTNEFVQVGADGVGSKELVDFINNNESHTTNGTVTAIDATSILVEQNSASGLASDPFIRVNLGSWDSKLYNVKIDLSMSSGGRTLLSKLTGGDITGTLYSIEYNQLITSTFNVDDFIYKRNLSDIGAIYFFFNEGTGAFIGPYSMTVNYSIKEALPLSTHYTLENGTYGITCQLATNHFSDADLAIFNETPELLLRWYWGEEVGISIARGSEDKLYWNTTDKMIELSDSSELLYDGTATYNTQLQYSVQDVRFDFNDAGIPIALLTNEINVENGYIDTQWKPNIATYSIKYICEGDLEILDDSGVSTGASSQRIEDRLLIKDTTNKYYIDAVLQSYVPTLPSSASNITLSDTPAIGYADTVDRVHKYFEVWNDVRTSDEILLAHNTFIAMNYELVLDDDNQPFTDEHGRYIYID